MNDNTSRNVNRESSAARRPWEIVAAFSFGIVFLTTILTTALFKPDPTPYQYAVFRIILALAAAGIGAILPGFFEIRNKIISASGALAMFLVVFLERLQRYLQLGRSRMRDRKILSRLSRNGLKQWIRVIYPARTIRCPPDFNANTHTCSLKNCQNNT